MAFFLKKTKTKNVIQNVLRFVGCVHPRLVATKTKSAWISWGDMRSISVVLGIIRGTSRRATCDGVYTSRFCTRLAVPD